MLFFSIENFVIIIFIICLIDSDYRFYGEYFSFDL